MASFDKAIPLILKHEGGWADHPNDPGGATNRGITFNTLKTCSKWLLDLEPTLENLKNLTEEGAKTIYKSLYWDKMLGTAIMDQAVANIIFDGYVNMGGNAIKLAQEIVGEEKDGVMGKKTLRGINQQPPREFFDKYKEARSNFYTSLIKRKPSLKVFEKGWKNRINSFNYERS